MPLRLTIGFAIPCFLLRRLILIGAWGWSEILQQSSQVFLIWHLSRWGSWRWEFPLLLDFISLFFRGIIFLIAFCVFIFAGTYMQREIFFKRFGFIVCFFLFSIQALVFIPHLIFLLVGWDGLGIRSYLLIIYYNRSKRLRSGMLTLAYNRLGDVFFLLLAAFLLKEGIWIPFFRGGAARKAVSVLLVLAAITKSAQIPFRAWLPAAIAAPTPVSALVHSSTLVTAGVFLSIRFNEVIFRNWIVRNIIFLLASLTTLLAGACALKEFDIKKIIALSTLSNLGIIIRRCRLGYRELAFFHLVVHALFKALLFISAGYLIDSCHHSQDLRFIGDIYSRFPLIRVSFLVANAALCGLPFLAGFYSKDLLLEGGFFFASSLIALGIYYIGLFLTFLYSLRVIRICLFSSRRFTPLSSINQKGLLFFLPLRFLRLLRVLLGAFLSSQIGDFQGEVIIDLVRKKAITGSIFFLLLFFGVGQIRASSSFLSLGLRSLFFLSIIRGQLSLPFLIKRGKNIFCYVDRGWKELVFPKFFFFLFQGGIKKIRQLTKRRGFIIFFVFLGLILILGL